MKIFKTAQIKSLDADNILRRRISSLELMEEAVRGLYPSVCEEIDGYGAKIGKDKSALRILVLAGPGNNGGDGLALSRLLMEEGYPTTCRLIRAGKKLSSDCQANADRLAAFLSEARTRRDFSVEGERQEIRREATDEKQGPGKSESDVPDFAIWDDLSDLPHLPKADVVIDSLFGSGLNRPLQGIFAELVRWINASKKMPQPSRIISIDLPSGLFGEDNGDNIPESIVQSDLTLGIQFPRLAFLLPENEVFITQWKLCPLYFHPECIDNQKTPFYFGERDDITALLRPRHTFDHKGRFGHALLLAGSASTCGASILASKACLRAGIGLLNLWSPEKAHDCIQGAVPEAMVGRCGKEWLEWDESLQLTGFTAVGIGPGIGVGESQALLLEKCFTQWPENLPLILDADGLNLLKYKPYLMNILPKNCLFSPHPKEFERIYEASLSLEGQEYRPSRNGYERLMRARLFAQKHQVTIILKGAYSAVIQSDGECWFNPSGNPGMATGGSGDVLSGILLSLLAQGYSCDEAAKTGTFLHGLSGDLALETESEESLTAGDLITYLGRAFKQTAPSEKPNMVRNRF